MKKILTILSLLGAATLAIAAKEKLGDIVNVGGTEFLLLREFITPEQNASFQRNVQIMRRYSQIISAAKKKLEEAKTPGEKTDLEAKIKKMQDEFDINEQTMRKVYAFAANRNYRLVSLESNICTGIDKESLSTLTLPDGTKLDPLKIFERGGNSFYRGIVISGEKENMELQRIIGGMVSRKVESDGLRKKLAATTDPDEQLKISSQLASVEKAMKESDADMRKKYGIKDKTDYIVEISKSKLYLALTPEEASELKAKKKSE